MYQALQEFQWIAFIEGFSHYRTRFKANTSEVGSSAIRGSPVRNQSDWCTLPECPIQGKMSDADPKAVNPDQTYQVRKRQIRATGLAQMTPLPDRRLFKTRVLCTASIIEADSLSFRPSPDSRIKHAKVKAHAVFRRFRQLAFHVVDIHIVPSLHHFVCQFLVPHSREQGESEKGSHNCLKGTHKPRIAAQFPQSYVKCLIQSFRCHEIRCPKSFKKLISQLLQFLKMCLVSTSARVVQSHSFERQPNTVYQVWIFLLKPQNRKTAVLSVHQQTFFCKQHHSLPHRPAADLQLGRQIRFRQGIAGTEVSFQQRATEGFINILPDGKTLEFGKRCFGDHKSKSSRSFRKLTNRIHFPCHYVKNKSVLYMHFFVDTFVYLPYKRSYVPNDVPLKLVEVSARKEKK